MADEKHLSEVTTLLWIATEHSISGYIRALPAVCLAVAYGVSGTDTLGVGAAIFGAASAVSFYRARIIRQVMTRTMERHIRDVEEAERQRRAEEVRQANAW